MKAVVVEIKDNVVAVLSDDGCIYKVKNRKYVLGQEIIFRNNHKYIKMAASIAACLMLFATPAWAYLTPYSYVSLDINPSFEFSINRFDRVLQVKAINDDGQRIAEQIDVSQLKNMEIKEAVKNVIIELKGQGYLTNAEEEGMVVAASSKSQEKTDKLATSLKFVVEEEVKIKPDNVKNVITEEIVKQIEEQKEIIKEAKEEIKEQKEEEKEQKEEGKEQKEEGKEQKEEEKEQKEEVAKGQKEKAEKEKEKVEKEKEKKEREENKPNNSKFEVEVIEVSQEAIDKAKDKGVTPGKMNLVEKLQLVSEDDFDQEELNEWLNKPVKDIMNEIKKYEKSAKESEKNNNKNNNENEKKSENSKENKSDNNKKPK